VVRNVIEMLATTYAEATNEKTPNTVNEEIRGPFWNFVDHFLKLMRLPRGNITRLINERGWRRQAIEVLGAQSSSPPMPISKSEPTSKIRDWLLAQYALDPNISTMHLASELDKRKDLVKRRVSYHAIDYFFIREGLRKTPPRQSPSARRKSLGITRTKPRWP